MSIKKPSQDFLANQPYLYRAFENGLAKIEVYDMRLDGWPADAHLVVDGIPHNAPGVWWYETREDQTDSETGERFSVLTFHDTSGQTVKPSTYLGTHKIQLVVNGQEARTVFLTILPWEDPIVEVESEEEINGDLVRITFKIVWPDATPRVMSVVPADENMHMSWEYNGPLAGYIANEFKVWHDAPTLTTRVSGVTYRFMESSVISMKVGAECITGVKDTGNFYSDSIDKRPVALFFNRGDYGEVAPRARLGFSMGAGCEVTENKAIAVGGTRNGMLPYFGMVKKTFNGNQPHDNGNYIRIFGCFNAHGRAGQWPAVYPNFDTCSHVWATDLTSSTPSRCISVGDNTPRIHPQVTISDGIVSWGHGIVMIPWVLADYTDYKFLRQGTTSQSFATENCKVKDAKPYESCREVWENKGDIIGRHIVSSRDIDGSDSKKTITEIVTLPNGSEETHFLSGQESVLATRDTTISAPGRTITIPTFSKVYTANTYRTGRSMPGDDVIVSGGF